MRVLLCVFVHVCVCVSLYLIVRERGTHREIPSVKQPVPPLGGARGSPQRLLAVLLQVCSCVFPPNFLMQGGGAKRGSGGKGRVTLLIMTETAGPWSPNSQRGLREAVPAHGSEPRTCSSYPTFLFPLEQKLICFPCPSALVPLTHRSSPHGPSTFLSQGASTCWTLCLKFSSFRYAESSPPHPLSF